MRSVNAASVALSQPPLAVEEHIHKLTVVSAAPKNKRRRAAIILFIAAASLISLAWIVFLMWLIDRVLGML